MCNTEIEALDLFQDQLTEELDYNAVLRSLVQQRVFTKTLSFEVSGGAGFRIYCHFFPSGWDELYFVLSLTWLTNDTVKFGLMPILKLMCPANGAWKVVPTNNLVLQG